MPRRPAVATLLRCACTHERPTWCHPATPRCGLNVSSRCACECATPFVLPQSIIYLSLSAPHSAWQAASGGRCGQAHNPRERNSHAASSLHVLERLGGWFSDHSTYSGPSLDKKKRKKKQGAKPRVLKIYNGWVSVASFIIAGCASRSVVPFHQSTLLSFLVFRSFFLKGTVSKRQTSGLSVGTALQSAHANAPRRNRWGSSAPSLVSVWKRKRLYPFSQRHCPALWQK